jgi:pantetheine-phosphate adenylyltransferase
MARTALYPGTFDPPTAGHLHILRTGFSLCERLVVGVGVHPAKQPMLAAEDRVSLLEAIAAPLADAAGVELEVRTFDGLVVNLARDVGATLLIRGLRDATDFDYEMQMAGMNRAMAPWLQTVFLPASPEDRHITATLVRQIAGMGGDFDAFVPAEVATHLRQMLPRR